MAHVNGIKNAIMQVTYVLSGSAVNLLFYCRIIIYWEKVTSEDKFSHNLAIKVQIGKFQHFNAIDGSIEMLKSSWIFKNFMSPTQQAARGKLCIYQIKVSCVSGTKIF